ncbi:MAG: HNH endonuclease signature motif containing protein [Peptostreptococcaceae bacterium]
MGYREDFFANNPSKNGWYTCVRCKKKLRKSDVDVDHIIPQSRGGSNRLNNLQPMCKSCNRSKKNDV